MVSNKSPGHILVLPCLYNMLTNIGYDYVLEYNLLSCKTCTQMIQQQEMTLKSSRKESSPVLGSDPSDGNDRATLTEFLDRSTLSRRTSSPSSSTSSKVRHERKVLHVIALTTSICGFSITLTPFTSTIRSPGRNPLLSAGELCSTLSIL